MSKNQELIAKLENTANKLSMMWGKNPDTDVIREAAAALAAEPEAEPVTKPAPTRVTKKGKANV